MSAEPMTAVVEQQMVNASSRRSMRQAPQAAPGEDMDMRGRIKAVATELLVRHGYRGVSFGDIAEALETTRANIHYHFGNKSALVEEVLDEYVSDTLERFRVVWTDSASSITAKVRATIAFNRERYDRFNEGKKNGKPWSLIARLRADADALTPRGVAMLRRFARELARFVEVGVETSIERGELAKNSPVGEIVIQLVSIANSAGPITQDAGNFARLEELYLAFLNTVQAAYGPKRQ